MEKYKIWYADVGDSTPAFISDETNPAERVDESYFLSTVPTDYRAELYTIDWGGPAPTLSRNADADDVLLTESKSRALSVKLAELEQERNERSDALIGSSDPHKKDKTISRAVKLLRKELKGNASQAEIDELNQVEALDNALDALYAEHDSVKSRSLSQIEGYDVVNDPSWP